MTKVEFVVEILRDMFRFPGHELHIDELLVASICNQNLVGMYRYVENPEFGTGLTGDSLIKFQINDSDVKYSATVNDLYEAMRQMVINEPEHHMLFVQAADYDVKGVTFVLELVPTQKAVDLLEVVNLGKRMETVND